MGRGWTTSAAAAILLALASCCGAFMPSPTKIANVGSFLSSASAATTEYDVVKVDLADGRDYPIYIGAGFSDEEGRTHDSQEVVL